MGKGWLTDIAKGEWWLPGAPQNRVPGLIVERGGRFRLELIGTFNSEAFSGSPMKYDLVCGFLAKGGPVTLISCIGSTSLSAPGMVTEECSFGVAVKGHHFDAVADSFHSVSACCPTLLAWMNRSGLEVKLTIPQEREISGIYEWSAIYRVPDPLVFHWSETVRFTLRVRPTTLPLGGLANKPVRIEQDCFVEAESSRLTTISSLHEALYDLELLVCLLSGFPGSLTLTSCSSPCAVGPDGRIRSLALQFDKQSDDEVNAANLDWERALVPYPKVQERFTDLVPRWRDVLDVQGKVVHAYFAGRHARHAEEQLLACANALQRLVESSEGRQSFERSVSQVIGCYLAPATATQSIQLLTKTRHYLTHYNPAENQDAARGAQLANLVDMVDAMVRCKLLELLGFSVDEIKGFIRDNYEFSKRITMNRWSEH